MADLTDIRTAEGWLFVGVVLVHVSRRAVGLLSVIAPLDMDALLHQSDQGSQYTTDQFQRLLTDNGITCSTGRAGNVWHNSAMEISFALPRTERTACKVYPTSDEAHVDVFDVIIRSCNPRRRPSKLG